MEGEEKHERSLGKTDINEEAWLLDGTHESGNTGWRRNDPRSEMRSKEANFFTKSQSIARRYSTHPIDYNLLFHAFTATSSENDKRSFREVWFIDVSDWNLCWNLQHIYSKLFPSLHICVVISSCIKISSGLFHYVPIANLHRTYNRMSTIPWASPEDMLLKRQVCEWGEHMYKYCTLLLSN